MQKRSIWMASEAEFDAWAVTEEDDRSVRPATEDELLQRSVVVGYRGEGVVKFHVLKRAPAVGEYPGRPIAAGDLGQRHRALTPATRAQLCPGGTIPVRVAGERG